MSKFLKFIVNIFLICAILIAAAILIPPLVGVQTTIVDTASMDTNLPLGSITYSTDVDASEIKVGDEVLKDNNTSTYAYIVKKIDKSSDTFTVVNAEDKNAENEEITLRNSVPKVAVVVPYIGYVIIAMHSTEGIVVIALVVVLIVILFILSELWKEKPEEEEDEEDSEKKTYSFIEENDEAEQGGAGELVDGSAPETKEQDGTENDEVKPVESDTEDTSETAVAETGASETEETETTEEPETSEAQEAQDVEADEETADAGAGDTQRFDFHLNPQRPKTDAQEEEEIRPADIAEDDISDVKIPELKRQVETPEDISRILSEPDGEAEEQQSTEIPEAPKTSEKNDSEQNQNDAYDLSEAIEQATREAEEQAAQDAAEKAQEKANAVKPEPAEAAEAKTDNNIEETQTEDQSGETEEEPEQFVPVEHATLDELMDQARKAGDEPDVSKDDATGITVVDYSGVL